MRISPIDAGISRKFETQSRKEIARKNNSGELIIKMNENKDSRTEFPSINDYIDSLPYDLENMEI